MDLPAYAINLKEIGVRTNKDISPKVLSLYRVHKSGSSHGNGLFARRDIEANEEIIKASGPVVAPEVIATLYHSYGIDIAIQIGLNKWVLPNNETRFINHSCNPNMGFGSKGVFVAMKKIRKKEELTFDYSMCEIDADWVIDCNCKSKLCRRRISGKDIFDKKFKLWVKYQGYLPKFVVVELNKHFNRSK